VTELMSPDPFNDRKNQ